MKRGRFEIIKSILIICMKGAKKTEITYKANLNFQHAEVYLQLLIDDELIAEAGKFFRTTPKGANLLSKMQSASILLGLR